MLRRLTFLTAISLLLLVPPAASGHCRDHDARRSHPHFHWHDLFGDHHSESNDEPDSEHDSDAVYVVSDLQAERPVSHAAAADLSLDVWGLDAAAARTIRELTTRPPHPPPLDPRPACPLFLQHLALLI